MSGNRLESNLRCSSVTVIVGPSFFKLFLQILSFGLVGLFWGFKSALKLGVLFTKTFQLLFGGLFRSV